MYIRPFCEILRKWGKSLLTKKENLCYFKDISQEGSDFMEKHRCLEYLLLPALSAADGYHFHPNLEMFGTPDEPLLHSHDYCEVCLIRSGRITVISQDVHFTRETPCLILYKNGCPHAQFNHRDTAYEKYMISLRESLPFALQSLSHQICRCAEQSVVLVPLTDAQVDWLFSVGARLEILIEEAKGDLRSETVLNTFRYFLSEILYLLENRPQTQRTASGENITRAMAYISEHLSENISLCDIARQVGMGRTKLNEEFQEYLSISVYQYILRERMVLAQRCLNQGHSVKEVSDLCGFNDCAHFIRTFKRYFSQTPGQYRKRSKE